MILWETRNCLNIKLYPNITSMRVCFFSLSTTKIIPIRREVHEEKDASVTMIMASSSFDLESEASDIVNNDGSIQCRKN